MIEQKAPYFVKKSAGFILNLPNKITLLRLICIPLMLLAFMGESAFFRAATAILFALGMLTDFVDGFVARATDSVTPEGALLDPIVDKLIILTACFLLVSRREIFVWMAVILVGRDVVISGLRLLAQEAGLTLAVNNWGKWKTGLTGVAIFCLLYREPLFGISMRWMGMIILWVALGLSVYSAYTYFEDYFRRLKGLPPLGDSEEV